MISVIIRNKNEAYYLEYTLKVLRSIYQSDFLEIIIVDNESTDDSIDIAKLYKCKVVTIKEFTYGRALNLGIKEASNEFILLLSAHVLLVGKSFFKTALQEFNENSKLAGLRFINSYENYQRAIENNYIIIDGVNYGLMNACAMIRKSVWEIYKFDETIVFSEDKLWSKQVLDKGYILKDVCETFFYFIKRNEEENINRWKNETLVSYQLNNKKYPNKLKLITSSVYKILIKNGIIFYKACVQDLKILKAKFEIKNYLNKF